MGEIFTAKRDHFAVAMDRGVIVFTAILAQKTFHQPGFGECRRHVENAIEKDLRNLPSFL